MHPIHRWHDLLDMPKYDEAWHRKDMEEERGEYDNARGFIATWSELSDIAYTYTRARWSGHTNIHFPFSRLHLILGIIYMLPKYTLRWRFFRALGHTFDPDLHLCVVRNPRNVEKLHKIATRHNLDPEQFQARAEAMQRHSFLLK